MQKYFLKVPKATLKEYLMECLQGYCQDFRRAKEILDNLCAWDTEKYFSFEVECTAVGIDICSNYNIKTNQLLKVWLFLSREIDNIENNQFHSILTCKYYPELRRRPMIVNNILSELGIMLKDVKSELLLTSDIDWPFYYPRTLLGYFRKFYHIILGSYKGDIFDTYRDIVNMGIDFQIPVKFFILPKGKGKHDPRIFEKRRLLKRLRKVAKSYDKVSFGIHIPFVPTSKYLKIVEKIGEELPLTGSRTHYLRRDDKIIAKSLGKMNSSYDYSAGYNDAPSTFYGTSIRVLSWKDYLLGNRIFKIPVYFMDVHLDYCGKLWSLEEFLELDKEIIQKTGFKRLIIWHNDKFHESSIYFERMKSLVNRLK